MVMTVLATIMHSRDPWQLPDVEGKAEWLNTYVDFYRLLFYLPYFSLTRVPAYLNTLSTKRPVNPMINIIAYASSMLCKI